MLLAGELVSILFSRSEFGCNEVYYKGRADMGLMFMVLVAASLSFQRFSPLTHWWCCLCKTLNLFRLESRIAIE